VAGIPHPGPCVFGAGFLCWRQRTSRPLRWHAPSQHTLLTRAHGLSWFFFPSPEKAKNATNKGKKKRKSKDPGDDKP